MYFCRNRVFITCVVIAIGSIVQSALHLTWLLYGHWLYECEYKPKNIFAHLISITYFYREKCSKTRMIDTNLFCDDITKEVFGDNNSSICQLGHDINIRAIMVSDVGPNTITTANIFNLIGTLECLWLVASVALMMGSWVKIKEAWSVLFYAPWLIVTTVLTTLDILTTWKYVSDFSKTQNVGDWLKFLGVRNHAEFSIYNDQISWTFTSMASMVMCAVACRLAVFTIVNLVALGLVLRGAKLAYSLSYVDEKAGRHRRRPIVFDDGSLDHPLELDATAARIRSWQMFYGTESPRGSEPCSAASSRQSSLVSQGKDSMQEEEEEGEASSGEDVPTVCVSGRGQMCRNEEDNLYSGMQKAAVVGLRGQLPWSYVPGDMQNGGNLPMHSILKKPLKYTDTFPEDDCPGYQVTVSCL